jgi:hypothetical protein
MKKQMSFLNLGLQKHKNLCVYFTENTLNPSIVTLELLYPVRFCVNNRPIRNLIYLAREISERPRIDYGTLLLSQ